MNNLKPHCKLTRKQYKNYSDYEYDYNKSNIQRNFLIFIVFFRLCTKLSSFFYGARDAKINAIFEEISVILNVLVVVSGFCCYDYTQNRNLLDFTLSELK